MHSKIKYSVGFSALIVMGVLFSQSVFAHRSGCHAWHSCPSDTGSYVCGDKGYSNYCGTSLTPKVKGSSTTSISTPKSDTKDSSSVNKSSRVGLSADGGLSILALDNIELKKWPSDLADRVDNRGKFGALMSKGWAGKIIESTSDSVWFNVDLNGNQSGWVKGENLKVIK